MSPTQRLRGIAALSAAALATAGLAGAGVAADECADEDCLPDNVAVPGLDELLAGGPSPEFIRAMIAASGGDISEDTMALIEQMVAPGQDLKDLFAKVGPSGLDQNGEVAEGWPAKWYAELPELVAAYGGEDIPEEMMVLIEQMVAQGSFLQPGQDLNDLLAKAAPPEDQTGEAFAKVEVDGPGEDAFIKVSDDLGEDAFLKILPDDADRVSIAEGALAQAVATGDIDQATFEAILELLDRE